MTRLLPRRATSLIRTKTVVKVAALATAAALLTPMAAAAPAQAANPVTPGNFTGFGFDQCLTPTQEKMDRWLQYSPFFSVGVYISGNSRWCRDQPNLTAAWVKEQLHEGWKILPITLGPQASCSDRFPRYDDDPTIDPRPGPNGDYPYAKAMARAEATRAVAEAQRLGIPRHSTLWYDLEAFDISRAHCRESALRFLSAWSTRLHELKYASGVYSSAASGIKILDLARANRPRMFTLPDQLWIADWDGKANTSSIYVSDQGWRGPAQGRVKQYRGGHDETHGGVTINIDSNFLHTGRGTVTRPEPVHCGGVRLNWRDYQPIPAGKSRPEWTKILQCFLTEHGIYEGPVNGRMTPATKAAMKEFTRRRGTIPFTGTVWRDHWTSVVATGPRRVLKFGSHGPEVRRVQRAMNATGFGPKLAVTGIFDGATSAAVKEYQKRNRLAVTGVVGREVWPQLFRGNR